MAGSLNRVTIIGHVGKDPETRTFQGGGKLVNLTIATSESWKDKVTGERKERTEWHNIAITNEGLAGVAEKYLHKGSKVYVEGQLETQKWQDKSGADRYTTRVVLRPFNGTLILLDGKAKDDRDDGYTPPASRAPGWNDMDDEVPF